MKKQILAFMVIILIVMTVALVYSSKMFDYSIKTYGYVKLESQAEYLALQQALAKAKAMDVNRIDNNASLYRTGWTNYAEIQDMPCKVAVTTISSGSLKKDIEFSSVQEQGRSLLTTRIEVVIVGLGLIVLLFIFDKWLRAPKVEIDRRGNRKLGLSS